MKAKKCIVKLFGALIIATSLCFLGGCADYNYTSGYLTNVDYDGGYYNYYGSYGYYGGYYGGGCCPTTYCYGC